MPILPECKLRFTPEVESNITAANTCAECDALAERTDLPNGGGIVFYCPGDHGFLAVFASEGAMLEELDRACKSL